ncbi:hypothetical protein [Xylanimonas ulmi]|uniref:Peptidoglycan binding protein n=1 Tax=Xylanimonas ulmi TaxID=228973 RepID=A0A4Q7M7Z8_9MICO|nr:hypothetical protein [Xylanibacterium ulmi]RZS63243.1 hypothetical protein EV386_3606 [Xylanibacterium ulmi]
MTPSEAGPAHAEQPAGSRGLRGPRLVLVVAGAAVVSLVAGLLAGRFVISPAQAAADAAPPEAGPITAAVERRTISNDVVLRADAAYADAVDVRIEAGDVSGPAVVTGQVPDVGAQLDAASVLIEVAGRPVIVLPGDLPVYRTLRVGTSGPDVLQLKAALAALGIGVGDAGSDVYDAATAAGVDALYAAVGYPRPGPGEDADATLKGARESVRAAESAIRDAEAAVVAAQRGPGDVERTEADNAVRAAERALAQAQAAQQAQDAAPVEPGEPVEPIDVAGAEDALTLARIQRAALDQPADTSAERAQVEAARRALADAQEELAEATTATLTALPASEVVYVAGLPRRVDAVYVERGGLVNGPVAAVSGAALRLEARVSGSNAALLTEGAVGEFELPDGATAHATVVSIGQATRSGDDAPDEGGDAPADGGGSDDSSSGGRTAVTLEPQDLTPEQVDALRDQNVRVTVSVGATQGEVLAVPIAALTAGPGGESRVEVRRKPGAETELITVTTGLAAAGFVEIVSADGALDVGDQVVVGT